MKLLLENEDGMQKLVATWSKRICKPMGWSCWPRNCGRPFGMSAPTAAFQIGRRRRRWRSHLAQTLHIVDRLLTPRSMSI